MFEEPPEELWAATNVSRLVGVGVSKGSAEELLVNLQGIQLRVNDKILLEDTELKLSRGCRYGFLSRNGRGKSMLMKSLAYRWLPGLPSDIKTFYIDQLENAKKLEMTVIDLMLSTREDAWRDWRHIEIIVNALGMTEDDQRKALLILRKERLSEKLWEVRRIAACRSGKRGYKSRNEVAMLEQDMNDMNEMNILAEGENVQTVLQQILNDLYDNTEDRSILESEALKILSDFEFPPESIHSKLEIQSGGNRIRVALAMAVFANPELLLLDEPTNSLDLPGILWLKNYLSMMPPDMTILIVTHDREFLNEAVDQLLLIRKHKLVVHDGNYDSYIKTENEQVQFRAREREALKRQRDLMDASIRKDASLARKKGDSKKLSQISSRKKKLEEHTGVQRNSKGHRFKLNRDRPGWHSTLRDEVEDEIYEAPIFWNFPSPIPLRSPGAIIDAKSISFSYNDSIDILIDADIYVEQGERVAIIGANGQGKTTLMNILARKLSPNNGDLFFHPQAKFAHFEQNFIDHCKDISETPLEYILRTDTDLSTEEAFEKLSIFDAAGFGNQQLSSLSGGQIVRFALSLLTLNDPHVLLLDEVTNHLDFESIEALQECLLAYDGAIILISHDLYFIRELDCSKIYHVSNQQAHEIGDIENYICTV